MQIVIVKDELKETPERLLKRAGYSYQSGKNKNSDSLVRRLGKSNFPRFHAYIKREGDKIIINLHLDQKQPSYPGVKAHSGESESEVVVKEIERLKEIINSG